MGMALHRPQRGPRGEQHSRADAEETLPEEARDRSWPQGHCPRSLPLPRQDSPTQTDENRMEIYFETLIFVSPLTFFVSFLQS